MINYIAGTFAVLFVLGVAFNQVKHSKKGDSGCCGGCSGCSARNKCKGHTTVKES